MDEVKQASEIDDALREVAKQRDKLLGKVPPLSPARRAVLTDFLAGEFPVETALREVATKRDQLLDLDRPEIPAFAESALHRQRAAAERACDGARASRASDWRVSAAVLLRFFRWPPGAVLTACAMITAAILCFGRGGTSLRRNSENVPNMPRAERVNIESGVIFDRSPNGRTELFTRKAAIGPFNLSTSEPASLQASFFANSGVYFADGIEASLGLRLDLPVKTIFMEDGLARTP